MIFITVIFTLIGLGIGFFAGRATQYHNAREKLRLRVIESNLDNLTTKKVTELLDIL